MEYLKGFSENSSIAVLVVDEASRKLISVKDVIFVTDSEIPTLFVVQGGESEDMDSD